jgi:hydrogenase maturation protease
MARKPSEPGSRSAGGKVLVVGFGNTLAGDDGVGPAVIDALREAGPPLGMRAEHGGADSLTLPSTWRGEPSVWLVDAVSAGCAPGTIHRLDHEEVLGLPQHHATAHYLSLPDSLRWISLAHPEMDALRYKLWGVEPERVEPSQRLSPAVAATVPRVTREILEAFAGSA